MKNLSKAYLINGIYYLYLDELNTNNEDIKLFMANGFMIIKFTEKELEKVNLINDESKLREIAIVHNTSLKTILSNKSTASYIINSINDVLISHVLGKEI